MRLARPDPPNAAHDDQLPGWALEIVTLMARSYGKLYTTIWADDDFTALRRGPQHVYKLLISQAKLTLAGSTDLMPERWAPLSADTTVDDILADLQALEASRFIVVDWATRELVVRTLVRHELENSGRLNSNLLKGLWSAWKGILSPTLRKVVVDHVPEIVWERSSGFVPAQAEQMRRSPRLELPVATASPNLLKPEACLLKPEAASREPRELPQQPDAAASATVPPGFDGTSRDVPPGFDQPSPAATGSERQQRIEAACQILTDRHLAVVPSRHNPAGHARSVLKGKLTDHAGSAHALLHVNPEMTPAQLADLLEPPAPQPAAAAHRAPPDPFAGQRAARQREMAENAQRLAANADVEPADPKAVASAAAEARAALRRAGFPTKDPT